MDSGKQRQQSLVQIIHLWRKSKLPQQEGILWNISKQTNDKKKDLELSISDSEVAIEEVEGSIAKLQEEAMPGGRDKDTWQSCFWSNWKKKKSLDQTNDRKKGPGAVYLPFWLKPLRQG